MTKTEVTVAPVVKSHHEQAMTSSDDREARRSAASVGHSRDGAATAKKTAKKLSPHSLFVFAVVWVFIALLGSALVIYGVGPLLESHAQQVLMAQYRAEVRQASLDTSGLNAAPISTLPPAIGTPVAVLEIGRLELQQAVVEGVAPAETEVAIGHVPGTAGLGQPGNCVVVGRRSGFGGPFGALDRLHDGDEILATTTQGQSVYRVRQVISTTIYNGSTVPDAIGSLGSGPAGGLIGEATATAAPKAPMTVGPTVALDDLYGPSSDDRLTLVSSASNVPWNSSRATVVTATLIGEPFAPTPQVSRSDLLAGNSGEVGAWPRVFLVLFGYLVVVVGAIVCSRRFGARAAYLIATPLVIALVIGLAKLGSQVLPAWM
jgi:sortase A